MRFAFVAKHRGIWPVSWICETLGVSRSNAELGAIVHHFFARSQLKCRFWNNNLWKTEPFTPCLDDSSPMRDTDCMSIDEDHGQNARQ
jgi:hypothetical protein